MRCRRKNRVELALHANAIDYIALAKLLKIKQEFAKLSKEIAVLDKKLPELRKSHNEFIASRKEPSQSMLML